METGINKRKSGKRAVVFIFCFFIYGMTAVVILPIKEDLTPYIAAIEGKIYSGEGVSEIQNGIAFTGNNLEAIDMIYINGKRSDQCSVIGSSPQRVIIDIPKEIYQDEESFWIQAVKRIGGGYKCKSKKYEVKVNNSARNLPQIIGASKDIIYHSSGKQRLMLTGENIDENCRIYVNGNETEVTYDVSNNLIGLYISPDMYEQRNSIEIVAARILSESQLLYGNKFEIKVQDVDYTQYKHTYDFVDNAMLIMHGAGEWKGYTYTNCLEAFESNYERGCRTFEIDFMPTSDGVIVGRHDWTTIMYDKQLVAENEILLDEHKRNNLPKTYDEICNMYAGRTPLTWPVLLNYLINDESVYIVTDTKYSNDNAVEYILGQMVNMAKENDAEEVLDRVVVQVYNQDMYRHVMEIYPFRSVIYTLYQSPDSNEAVLDFVDHSNVRAITLPQNSGRDDAAFFEALKSRGCYIFVHTINDTSTAAQYFAKGCSGIYTDSIRPEQIDELNAEILIAKACLAETESSADMVAKNKEYLLNYLEEIQNGDYLVLLSVQDEATAMVDDEIAEALSKVGVSSDYRYAYRQSYLGIMNNGSTIYEMFSEDLLEYKYIDGENIFVLKSAGNGVQEVVSIVVNGEEQATVYGRGLHIVVFNRKLGVVEDKIIFDLYEGLMHTSY